MAVLNQFQQYSQGENTITNNVLLMLSTLYSINPSYYEEYLNALLGGNELIEVIPAFRQQVSNKGNGIIDGHITTKRSTIILETKINSLEAIPKLVKYTESFKEDETSVLIHLSKLKYVEEQEKLINEEIRLKTGKSTVKFYSLTYEDLVIQLADFQKRYPYIQTLERLAKDFEIYCQITNLLNTHKLILRAMACGESIELNIKYNFYFDMAERGYSPFNYFGIYANKSVRYVALVENAIVADWSLEGGLEIKSSLSEPSDSQIERLSAAIKETVEVGWRIQTGHRFFLLKDITPTHFKKKTPGGIYRVRYFNLKEILKRDIPKDINTLAELLRHEEWE